MEQTFVITKRILRAYKQEGYEAFNIIGRKGVGKTTYAVKIMTQIFMSFGYSEDEAYRIAIKHLIFDKREIIDFLTKHSNHQQPVLCWDDLRSHASGFSAVTAPIDTQKLLGLLDTARDSICGFLSTSPSMQGVLGFIKREEGYHVKIKKDRNGWRVATGYQRYELPSGQMRIAPKFADRFYRLLPDDIYKLVKEKRAKYKQIVLKNLSRDEDRTESDVQKERIQNEIALVRNDGTFESEEVENDL